MELPAVPRRDTDLVIAGIDRRVIPGAVDLIGIADLEFAPIDGLIGMRRNLLRAERRELNFGASAERKHRDGDEGKCRPTSCKYCHVIITENRGHATNRIWILTVSNEICKSPDRYTKVVGSIPLQNRPIIAVNHIGGAVFAARHDDRSAKIASR